MRKTILLLCVSLLLAGSLCAQKGRIVFVQDEHDFGTVPEAGGNISYTFQFENKGDSPIVIQSVGTSCGCTASSWTHDPVLPGKIGEVTATYRPMGRPNAFTKTLTVRSNADPSIVVLTIKGFVMPRDKTPQEVYSDRVGPIGFRSLYLAMGRVLSTGSNSANVEVYNFGDTKEKLTFKNLPEYMSISPSTVKVPKDGSAKFTIRVDGTKSKDWGFITVPFTAVVGQESKTLNLAFSRDEDFSKMSFEERQKAPRVKYDTRLKEFGQIKFGDSTQIIFPIQNIGKSDLIIREIKDNCDCKVDLEGKTLLKPNEKANLRIRFIANQYRGFQMRQITLITNDPLMPNIVFEISGTVQ